MDRNAKYMMRAVELAQNGMGVVSPNPMVGCVVVKEGKILAEGCHERYGGFHAERNVLTKCGEEVRGADLYVTLEPCCHHGKTPPCTEIILEKQIGRVFVGSLDPNPKVAGKGIELLREGGIEVVVGLCERECRNLNEIFFHYIQTGMPYVAMKYAMTLDGKIATASGDSKWITGKTAREHVHMLRKKYSAILVGIGTVLADNPMLNCRIEDGVDPVRIICDSHLRIPVESRIVKTAGQIRTILAHVEEAPEENRKKVLSTGVELINTGSRPHVCLKTLLQELGRRGIDSVLVEGGGRIHGSFLETGMIQRVYAYIAPTLVGGRRAKSPVEGKGFDRILQAGHLEEIEMFTLGKDVCITGNFCLPEAGERQKGKEEETDVYWNH